MLKQKSKCSHLKVGAQNCKNIPRMDGYWAEHLDLHYHPMTTRDWQENFTPVFFFFCQISHCGDKRNLEIFR